MSATTKPKLLVCNCQRTMDIDGARHHGMRNIGVLWGFGGEAELRQAGALHLAAHPRELPSLLAA